MRAIYSNVAEVPLSLAVFLATDNYDYSADPYTISATTLIKPVRQTILAGRIPPGQELIDLTQTIAPRIGSAIHEGIEYAWKHNHKEALALLGYPKKVIERVLINPSEDELFDGCIPIYLEQRLSKQVGKWTITGKFDFIGDGRIEDFKTTSTFSYLSGNNNNNYAWQGSIYRWLGPEIITKDEMAIQFIFTDWQAVRARTDPKYPKNRFHTLTLPLRSIPETEAFVLQKLRQLEEYWDAPEEELPLCNDEELWRGETVYRYYKNPANTGRSTRNFTSKQEAYIRLAKDGNVGIVREQPGKVAACKYCPAFSLCTQKDALIASGDLTL